ncbi:MAG: hypothetical protein KatS3mg014_0008 [Actinomycetota bacterium]|nr:MAG: hypothetical protein KatS3mg014_0008 [Actinomycetota bacterium]
MNWWCSARGLPWDWTWKAFPGAWILVGAMLAAYWVPLRRLRPRSEPPSPQRPYAVRFVLGVVVVWVAVDWPLGLLGAGYLLSAHMVQHILLTLVAAPLLLAGTPPELARMLLGTGRRMRIARAVTRPVPALVLYNAVLILTFVPAVVDAAMPTQLGSFAVEMAWLASALVMWSPVMAPLPEIRTLSAPGAMVYLFLQSLAPTIPASFLTFGRFPLYGVYELAPRVWNGLSAGADHRIAGLVMKIGGGLVLWGFITWIFFTWYASESRGSPDAGHARRLEG